jgi:hypothetical protein
VLASGHIQCGSLTGSIHAVAKALANAPCNGWDMWLVENENGEKVLIDSLRVFYRGTFERGSEG